MYCLHSKEPMALTNNMESYFKTIPPDCSLFSEGDHEFQIHKELLYQTRYMREMVKSVSSDSRIKVFCPSLAKEELKTIVDFLYSGKILHPNEIAVSEITKSLQELFGFSLDQTDMYKTDQPIVIPETKKIKHRKSKLSQNTDRYNFSQDDMKMEEDRGKYFPQKVKKFP